MGEKTVNKNINANREKARKVVDGLSEEAVLAIREACGADIDVEKINQALKGDKEGYQVDNVPEHFTAFGAGLPAKSVCKAAEMEERKGR